MPSIQVTMGQQNTDAAALANPFQRRMDPVERHKNLRLGIPLANSFELNLVSRLLVSHGPTKGEMAAVLMIAGVIHRMEGLRRRSI